MEYYELYTKCCVQYFRPRVCLCTHVIESCSLHIWLKRRGAGTKYCAYYNCDLDPVWLNVALCTLSQHDKHIHKFNVKSEAL